MAGRATFLEDLVRRPCLKCGKKMLTTKYHRICPRCHRENERVRERLVRVELPVGDTGSLAA